MYAGLDVVGAAVAAAGAAALADRLRYRPFFEAAERFAAAQGLVVGGPAATRLLLGDPADPAAPPPLGLDAFQCDFYGDRAEAQARALADALHAVAPAGLGHYAVAAARAPGRAYAVAVDGRDLFTVAALPVHRGVRTAAVVIPSRRPAQFAAGPEGPLRLACLGPELQLMGLYAALCDPGRAGDWPALLAPEAGLRRLLGREYRAKIAAATGGRGAGPGGGAARLRAALLAAYAGGPGRVLVGPAAIALTGGAPPPPGARVQVVAAGPLEAEGREIAALAARLGLAAEWAVHDPRVPTDPRLRRLTVSVAAEGRRAPVADVFNAAAHELVPYVPAAALAGPAARAAPPGLKVGTPFALMRFRLADMWTMQVLLRLGAVEPGYARGVLHEMLADFEGAAAAYERALARAPADPAAAAALLCPPGAYVGRLEDAGLAQRRAAAADKGARFAPPYYPAARAGPRVAAARAHARAAPAAADAPGAGGEDDAAVEAEDDAAVDAEDDAAVDAEDDAAVDTAAEAEDDTGAEI